MGYKGDIPVGQILYFTFYTVNTAGAPTTLAGTPAVSVYKNDSTTESTAGVTLTVDHDGRTGCHKVKIDTSADGTFYAAGNDFSAVITAGTVGGTSVVGAVVGGFSIENRTQKADVRKWIGTAVATPDTAGYPKVTVKQGTGTGELDLTAGRPGIDLAKVSNPGATLNLSATTIATVTAVSTVTGDVNGSVGSVGSPVDLSTAAIDALWEYPTASIATAGGIGKLIKDMLDASIGSRLAAAAVTIVGGLLQTDVKALDGNAGAATFLSDFAVAYDAGTTGWGTLDAAGVRAAVGLGAANLDAQLGAIDDFLDTEVAAILAAVDTEIATLLTRIPGVVQPQTGDAFARLAGYRLGELLSAALAAPAAGSLYGDLTEDDAGTQRFNANALEQAPAGGGGGGTDWTADERSQIRYRLNLDGTQAVPAAGAGVLTQPQTISVEMQEIIGGDE